MTPLAEAQRLAEELATPLELARAERLESHVPHVRPGGLSEREVEVLRLVAAGQTNAQIGETLVISEHTVANHLAHILQKTDEPNRAGATAWALRHGIDARVSEDARRSHS